MKQLLIILFICCIYSSSSYADVVKPALIEINVTDKGELSIEVRASVEALLTGINSQYKNTKDAPTAAEYDKLRKKSADELTQIFTHFHQQFLQSVYVLVNNEKLLVDIASVEIPPTGYTKIPRISVITLTGQLPQSAESLQWFYPESFGDNAVRVRQVDEENQQWHWSQWQWLRNNRISEPFSLTEIVNNKSTLDVIASYIVLGFEHIVPKGLDHILFILGLFLLSTRIRPLLMQVTMFTVAHTITLGLSMNNVISLPPTIVEPLIALSIAYVGIENVVAKHLHKSRLVLVFLFGLLHGLGFASVLADFGMPQNDFAEALISFNVGVELGQLAVISIAFLLLRLSFKDVSLYRKIIVVPGSVMISIIGLYWFVDRLELFQ